MDGGGSACRECIAWAIQDIQAEAKAENISSSLELAMMEQACRLRGAIGTLYDFAYQPIPFFYVHFITLVSGVYLPIAAYAIAYSTIDSAVEFCAADDTAGYEAALANWEAERRRQIDTLGAPSANASSLPTAEQFETTDFCWDGSFTEILGIFIVVMSCIFVLGLQAVGHKLADPYGNDVIDMSVEHFLSFTLKSARKIVEAERVAGSTNTGPTTGGALPLVTRPPIALSLSRALSLPLSSRARCVNLPSNLTRSCWFPHRSTGAAL